MTLSLFFTIPHWWKTEKTKCRRLSTLPLLILQLWPQYRAFQLLIALWKDQNKYHDKLEKFNRDVSSLEPFIEAVPTVFILLAIFFRDGRIFYTSLSDLGIFGIPKIIIFWTTFGLSVFSASMGISKFIKIGPCQILPSDKWHCGFFLVFLNVFLTLCAKGCVLAISLSPFSLAAAQHLNRRTFITIFIIWLSTCILPNLILAMLILVKAVGLKNTGRVIWRYPALVLMPIFSFWTTGPPKSSNSCCGYCQRSYSIEVSYFYTLLNATITIVVNCFFILFIPTYLLNTNLFDCNRFHGSGPPCDYLFLSLAVACPLFFVSFICLIVITCCTNSECCGTPLTNRENFYIEDLDEVADQNKEQGIEMKEVLRSKSRMRKVLNVPEDFIP